LIKISFVFVCLLTSQTLILLLDLFDKLVRGTFESTLKKK